MSKRIPRPAPTLTELVAPFVANDPTRTNLNTPFGFQSKGVGYIAATDGHRAALVRADSWVALARSDAPPLDMVVPWDAPMVGQLTPCDWSDDMLAVPRSWSVGVNLASPTTSAVVSKTVSKGKKSVIVHPFGRDPIETRWPGIYLEMLKYPLCIQLSYLIDACDFLGTGAVQVHHGRGLDPIVLLPAGATSIREAQRIAVVMPRRP